jgi:hypothetical protein
MSSPVGLLLVLMAHGRTVMTHPFCLFKYISHSPSPSRAVQPAHFPHYPIPSSVHRSFLSGAVPLTLPCPALCLPSSPPAPNVRHTYLPSVRPLNPRSSLLSTPRHLSFRLHLLSFLGPPQARLPFAFSFSSRSPLSSSAIIGLL